MYAYCLIVTTTMLMLQLRSDTSGRHGLKAADFVPFEGRPQLGAWTRVSTAGGRRRRLVQQGQVI